MSLTFLWPFPPEARTAAAVRLMGFVNAAHALRIIPVVIVPAGGKIESHSIQNEVIRLPLYDSISASIGALGGVVRFPSSTLGLITTLRRSHCECLVSSTPGPFVPFQGLLASKVLGIPYVLDIRDSWGMEKATHQGWLRNAVKEWIERICAGAANRVFCVTKMLAMSVRERYRLNDNKVIVVTNGADLSSFHPGNHRDIDMIFLGTPAEYRNTTGVLEGIAQVSRRRPNISARLIGWAGAPQTASLLGKAKQLAIPGGVEFLPPIPHSEVPSIVSRARLGIVSLFNDDRFRTAIGAKTYEYIASGVPLACLGPDGKSELRELVEGRSLGFFASNPEEFGKRTITLLEDEPRWLELSNNCIAVSQEYDRRKISERALREVVLPLMGQRSRG